MAFRGGQRQVDMKRAFGPLHGSIENSTFSFSATAARVSAGTATLDREAAAAGCKGASATKGAETVSVPATGNTTGAATTAD